MKVKKFLKKFDENTLVRLMESTEDGGAKHVQTALAKYVCRRKYRNRKIDKSKHMCVCTHIDIYILPEDPHPKLNNEFYYKNSEYTNPECDTCVFRDHSAKEPPCAICTDKNFMWTSNKKYKEGGPVIE